MFKREKSDIQIVEKGAQRMNKLLFSSPVFLLCVGVCIDPSQHCKGLEVIGHVTVGEISWLFFFGGNGAEITLLNFGPSAVLPPLGSPAGAALR